MWHRLWTFRELSTFLLVHKNLASMTYFYRDSKTNFVLYANQKQSWNLFSPFCFEWKRRFFCSVLITENSTPNVMWFRSEVAKFAIDPMVRGICAGDAKAISAKAFVAGPMFNLEQDFGSVFRGLFKRKIKGLSPKPFNSDSVRYQNLIRLNLVLALCEFH